MTALIENPETQVLTVNEYATQFNIPVDTVRSRIRLGKLKTTKIDRDGRSLTGVLVEQRITVNETVRGTIIDSGLDSHKPVTNSGDELLVTVLNSQIDDLKLEIDRLRLLTEKWEAEANSWRTIANEAQTKVAELGARLEKIDAIEKIVSVQQQTIDAQRIANDALNNERVVITQQLQKYRSVDNETQNDISNKAPAWMFWKR